MPESRSRKRDVFTPPPESAEQAFRQRRWVAPIMVACFVIGLAWVVAFYIAGDQIPGMSTLGNWNIIVGMGLIATGFIVSTQWR